VNKSVLKRLAIEVPATSARQAGSEAADEAQSRCGDTVAVTKRERTDPEVLHHRAQIAVLSGLARSDDVFDLMAAAAPSHVQGWFTPDVALLELAVTALDLACPAGAQPLEYEGLRERYLPEVTFRGRVEHRNSQYAMYAAACMRGGLQPDLLSDAGWWQTPLWRYAVFAVVIYSRAAAERLAVPVEEIARRVAARHGLELTPRPVRGQQAGR
jgi:hypothetical protein